MVGNGDLGVINLEADIELVQQICIESLARAGCSDRHRDKMMSIRSK